MNAGDTGFMLICSALVFFMTPGLAFFYGGLVRRKNVVSTMMACAAIMGLSVVMWVLFGYSLSFGGNHAGIIGDFRWFGLHGIKMNEAGPYASTIPHLVYIAFQMMFAMITPALITGSLVGRVKFKALFLFIMFWSVIVYYPMAHMVWGQGGFLAEIGSVDFAGGNVVHISSGVSALVFSIILGRRRGYEQTAYRVHNIPFVALGAFILWFGWFGFNAGSELGADGIAASAFLVTNTAAAVAAVSWMIVEYVTYKKFTLLGIASGIVAGLVAITPAAGFVDTAGALVIGLVAGVVAFYGVNGLKKALKYDDSLDAFGIHGLAGIWGAIATGIFANPEVNELGKGLLYGNPDQLLIQVEGVVVTAIYTAIATAIVFKIASILTGGARVESDEESQGLDEVAHGEKAFNLR